MSNSTVGLVVAALYSLAVIAVGVYGRRLALDSDMFNVFGRRARFLRNMSGYLSLIGGGELILLSQLGYDNGADFIWLPAGWSAGFLVLAFFGDRLRVVARERNINTLSGYFGDQFGKSAGLAITFVFCISLGSLLVIQFLVGADLLNAVLGLPKQVTVVFVGLIILSYLMPSGFVAVLSTDVLRAIMMTIVLCVIAGVLLVRYFDALPSIHSFEALPHFEQATYFVLGAFGVISAADVWQTIFASQDRRTSSNALTSAAIVFPFLALLVAFLGMLTKSTVPVLEADQSALLAATRYTIPMALMSFVALLITGSVMATGDTEIWVISSSIVTAKLPSGAEYDPKAKASEPKFQDKVKSYTRFTMPVVTGLAMVLALASESALALYQGLLILLTAIAPVMCAVLLSKPSRLVVVTGLWTALLAFVGLSIYFAFAIPMHLALYPALCSLASMTAVWVTTFAQTRSSNRS